MGIIKAKSPILFYGIFSLAVLNFMWFFKSSNLSLAIDIFSYKSLFDILIVMSFIYYRDGFRFFGKSHNVFMVVLILFHLGIPISNSFAVSENYFSEYITSWYYNENTVRSLAAINIFLLFYFAFGAFKLGDNKFSSSFFRIKNNNSFYKINLIFLYALVFVWIFTVYFVFGIKEYSDIYSENKDPFLSLVLIFAPQFISFSFLIIIGKKEYFYKAWFAFLLWAMFAFNLGIRGPVLFPLSISLLLLVAIHNYKITMLKFASIMAFLCIIISYKFFSRAGLQLEWGNINPLLAFQEMGSSLRPLNEVFSWLNADIYNYQYGVTYFAPLERAFIGLFPLYDLPADIEDVRLMNVAIYKNAGPYGFSIIAESLINFGLFGVAVLGIVLSYILRKIDAVMVRIHEYPLFIIILLGLFSHIRQAFVVTWGVILYLSIYLLFVYMLSRLIGAKREG